MSTASVSSPKKKGSKQVAAKWDDDKTKLLLEVFSDEIDKGNRPAGVFSKQGWINIVSNFKLKSNLDYNKEQLKNRQDNLRREFSRWERLIGKETGLGWNNDKRTLDAPDEWWQERAKVDPGILKYKEQGPLHLELLQKVFAGTTATEAFELIPETQSDPRLNNVDHLDSINVDDEVASGNAGEVGTEPEPTQVDTANMNPLPSQNARSKKRLRRSSNSRSSQGDRFSATMDSLSETIRENIQVFSKMKQPEEETLTYRDALVLLRGVPGMVSTNPKYVKAVRILEDKVKRIAFSHMLEDGVEGLIAWIDSFP